METNVQIAKFQEQTNRAMEDIRSQLAQLIQTLSVMDPGQCQSQPNSNSMSKLTSDNESYEQNLKVTVGQYTLWF